MTRKRLRMTEEKIIVIVGLDPTISQTSMKKAIAKSIIAFIIISADGDG